LDSFEIHIVCGLLKRFLRELPEPLMTFDLYKDIINLDGNFHYLRAYKSTNRLTISLGSEDLMQKLKKIVEKLPNTNRNLLKHLLEFLGRVSDHQEYNKMTNRNLATVFGPLLIRGKDLTDVNFISESGIAVNIMENMISKRGDLFEEVEPMEIDLN
jgi:hypothetical protein